MKHPKDKKTLEIPALVAAVGDAPAAPAVAPPPVARRGRPKSGVALSNAERQKQHRARLKAAGKAAVTVTLPLDVVEALRKYVEFKDMTTGEAVERIMRDRLLRKR